LREAADGSRKRGSAISSNQHGVLNLSGEQASSTLRRYGANETGTTPVNAGKSRVA